MKKIISTVVLLLVLGISGVNAQTTSTRIRGVNSDDDQNTEKQPPVVQVSETQTQAKSVVPAPSSPAPSSSVPSPSPVVTTKGGQPVSGNIETTLFIALMGMIVMGYGAYKLK